MDKTRNGQDEIKIIKINKIETSQIDVLDVVQNQFLLVVLKMGRDQRSSKIHDFNKEFAKDNFGGKSCDRTKLFPPKYTS